MILLETFHQGGTWTTATGDELRISEMEPRHCRNVIAFLRRRADEIVAAEMWQMTTMQLPQGEMACESVELGIEREMEAMSDPVAWLNATPLIQALKDRANEVGQ